MSHLDKLCSFYGFTRTPFRRDLAPAMLHRHGGHDEAVARIRWCISETALGVITGEVGAGKTVALRAALAELDASRHTVIYLPNPAVGARGLYAALVSGLGGVPRFHTASLIAQTMDHLAAEKHERGRAVIVAVDEAHLLSADQLEELRLLTNSEMDSVAPFTGLLLGQPTLRRRIKLGSFAALDGAISPGVGSPPRPVAVHIERRSKHTDIYLVRELSWFVVSRCCSGPLVETSFR